MARLFLGLIVPALAATFVTAAPRIRVARDTGAALRLGLPSNATSIRASEMISESFTCAGRHYGYYADPDNDCQLFHVCLPVQFDDGRSSMYKWSFVCPEETVFNQETFTCSRREDAIACEDSERFYNLNDDFGRQRPAQQADVAEGDVMETESAEQPQPQPQPQPQAPQQQQYLHAAQHGMDRPMEGRPLVPVRPVMEQQADGLSSNVDSSGEVTTKYGAFTTIRY